MTASQDEDVDALMSQSAEDIAHYFNELAEKEAAEVERVKSNVVPIRVDLSEAAAKAQTQKHTDDELIPETPADYLFSKLCFDPQKTLLAAAHEAWLLDDLLPASGISFIYGPPSSYKSFIAMDMTLAITSGSPWHGYECEMPGACLYIAAEGSRGIMERVVAWENHHGKSRGPLAILTVPVMMDDVVMVQAFTECLERAQEALGAPIRMVVIDTMARSFNGDENSAQEVGAFINACSRFSQDIGNCLVKVVAHTGKDLTRGMRGSSALDGAADCHFMVTKPNQGQALVKNTKQKDIEMAEPMRFAMELVSTGIVDRKDRMRRSLVPVLESKGEDADPDTEEVTAFDHKDSVVLAGMVKAAEREGRKITEDDLRKEFIDYLMHDAGKKKEAATKAWQRTYKRTRDAGGIMKAGIYIYPGIGK